MKIPILFLFSCLFFISFGQQIERNLPVANYFRDQQAFDSTNYTSVFPILGKSTHYFNKVQDPKKRYSAFAYNLFHRELIEYTADEGKLWITPILNFQYGKSWEDSMRTISQNTRGIRIEGTLGKKLSFTTAIIENQVTLPAYMRAYAQARGEVYPNYAAGTFSQVNAVLFNAGRTKNFKQNGFDYGFALGGITWKASKKLILQWGNTTSFIGSGYRSMLWSDNAPASMNLRVNYQLSKRFTIDVLRMRGHNLLRRAENTSVEALYQTKLLGYEMLHFQVNKQLKIGVVECLSWFREDSLKRTTPSASFFIPLIGLSNAESKQKVSSFLAVDVAWKNKFIQVYTQFGSNLKQTKSGVFQLGTRFLPFRNKLSFVQVEYNFSDKNAYTSVDKRMHLTNHHIFVAHPMGAAVSELVLRCNYEFRQFFLLASGNYYFTQNQHFQHLLSAGDWDGIDSKAVLTTQIQLGFHINRSYGLSFFSEIQGRKIENQTSSFFRFGVKTALTSLLNDF